MNEAIKTNIIDQLLEIINELAPNATLRPLYGGTVIELVDGDPKSRVGGVYVYQDYVTLELSRGALFKDPNRVLEGNGKFRRHLKLRELTDVTQKKCHVFLQQAIDQHHA